MCTLKPKAGKEIASHLLGKSRELAAEIAQSILTFAAFLPESLQFLVVRQTRNFPSVGARRVGIYPFCP
jgi:hypothetical protein